MAKGFKNTVITVAAILSACTSVAILINLFEKKNEDLPQDTHAEIVAKDSVNESLADAMGDVKLTISNNLPLSMDETLTCLGSDELESVVIEAGKDGTGITITGDVRSAICLTNENATLTFKGLTFYDEYAGPISYITDYTAFAGKIAFEDCIFTQGIRLKSGTNMTFDGCTFQSHSDERYGVWVEDGTVTIKNSTFKGGRGMKIHEAYQTPTDDIQTVRVMNSLFDNLQSKCGVAIGTVNPATTVALTTNKFIGCRSWDTQGSLEGLDGIYESDTPVRDYTLILEANEVRGTVSNIYYFAVMNGKIMDKFPTEFLKAEHPTTYIQESGATIPGLKAINGHRLDLKDCWYTNEACTEKFSGTIVAGKTGDVYLYAVFIDDNENWTQNY